MGADPLTLTLVSLAAASVGSKIAGGISENKAAGRESGLQAEQALLARDEAQERANTRAKQVRRFAAGQKLAFLKNGVSLKGSPVIVLDDTFSQGQEEVNAIAKRGNAHSRLFRERAKITRNRGRAALIGGFGDAAGSIFNAFGPSVFGKKTASGGSSEGGVF